MRFPVVVLLVTILAACSTVGTKPADVAAGVPTADVTVRLGSPLFFGASRAASAMFDVTVRNQAAVPVTLRRIHLSTGGMLQYVIEPLDRTFAETLAPGESKTVRLTTGATASVAGINPTEPMHVRVEAEFETTNGRRYRKIANIMNVAP